LCIVDAGLNKNEEEENNQIQEECPVYSVVKNSRASTSSESSKGSGQD